MEHPDGTQTVHAEHVISTLGAPQLSALLDSVPGMASLQAALQTIPFHDVGVVNVGWKGELIEPHHRGFGYLVPSKVRTYSHPR